MDKLTIFRDTREINGWDFQNNDKVGLVVEQTLRTGDYTMRGFEEVLVIERKRSVTELAQNVTQDRFLRELDRMLGYDYRFVVCEFDIPQVLGWPHNDNYLKNMVEKIRVTPKFIMSFVSMMQVEYGINVVFCSNRRNAECCAVNIMRRVRDNGKDDQILF